MAVCRGCNNRRRRRGVRSNCGARLAVTERLLTAREVAERLGLTTETVLVWVRRGELPAFRLGRAIRFRERRARRLARAAVYG